MSKAVIIEDWYDDELKELLSTIKSGVSGSENQGQETDNAEQLSQQTDQFVIALIMARHRAGLRQTELAAKVGISQSSLARIESGRTNPTLKTLLKLAAALDMRLSLQLLQ